MTATAKAGIVAHAPTILVTNKTTEQQKYERMWALPEYRAFSPGEEAANTFLAQAKPLKDSTCIDFGCGTGRGGLMIALFGNMIVTLVDFAANALDPEVQGATVTQPHRISWLQADLHKGVPAYAGYGYCTDVMEHIPPEEVDVVLHNIFKSATHVFFQISCTEDHCGALIDEDLHLTIQPYSWWLKKMREHNAVIHWSREDPTGSMCQIYATTWIPKDEIEHDGEVNTELAQVKNNIRSCAKRDLMTIVPHELQADKEVMMLCGGPSLNDYTDEIIKQRAGGMPLVTTNGTYNWAIMNGMEPSMQLIIDARPFNKRFVQPVVDGCKYMIASQCDPSVFEGLPPDRTYAWHVSDSEEGVKEILDELYEIWFQCPGGSTVTLRGLCLLRMLGFHKIHMYGFDSCYRDTQHHAYEQLENDYHSKSPDRVGVPVSVGGKVFRCDPWMFVQAKEWMQLISVVGDEFSLNIKGDGLIAHIINTGVALSALDGIEE